MPDAIGDAKRELRRRMRAVRTAIDGAADRDTRLWSEVRGEPSVQAAEVVMAYSALPGEPDPSRFVEWCRSHGKVVVVPAAEPTASHPDDPRELDVVIVPGLAFTPRGDRLGQGGGWYDRLLAEVRPDCAKIGVCFAAQIVGELPVDDHDVPVDVVICEDGRR